MPISIIIPVYACSDLDIAYLGQCLGSCISQTDDVVVWDDGSLVDLSSVVGSYPKTSFFKGVHTGKSYSRNQAVLRAKYDLIYPVDADDWVRHDVLSVLYERWDGTPLYSDLIFVHGNDVSQIYPLLPFDCDLCVDRSIASVNVLHSKKQWESVEGWNENLNLYEDWEYNARLFWFYCAHKVNIPLVYYRQHERQSTRLASRDEEVSASALVKKYAQAYINRRIDTMVGCCGKRRLGTRASAAVAPQPMMAQSARSLDLSTTADIKSMGDPGPGKVWAKYFGGNGMAEHQRRGMGSRRKYRVMYGGTYAVAVKDAVSADTFRKGGRNCGFVIIEQPPAPAPVPAPRPIRREQPKESKAKKGARSPITKKDKPIDMELSKIVDELAYMSVKELRHYIGGLDIESITLILEAERRGKKRVGAVKILEKAIDKATSGG